MTAEALRGGIASGAFYDTCLSNLPTLSGMSLEWYQTNLPRHMFRHITDSHLDPVTGTPLGYSPVTPAGHALCLLTNTPIELMVMRRDQYRTRMFGNQNGVCERPYFWMWQQSKYTDGCRLFVTTEHKRFRRTDNQVSWYYQTFIEYLTPEELEQEQRYRASRPHVP